MLNNIYSKRKTSRMAITLWVMSVVALLAYQPSSSFAQEGKWGGRFNPNDDELFVPLPDNPAPVYPDQVRSPKPRYVFSATLQPQFNKLYGHHFELSPSPHPEKRPTSIVVLVTGPGIIGENGKVQISSFAPGVRFVAPWPWIVRKGKIHPVDFKVPKPRFPETPLPRIARVGRCYNFYGIKGTEPSRPTKKSKKTKTLMKTKRERMEERVKRENDEIRKTKKCPYCGMDNRNHYNCRGQEGFLSRASIESWIELDPRPCTCNTCKRLGSIKSANDLITQAFKSGFGLLVENVPKSELKKIGGMDAVFVQVDVDNGVLPGPKRFVINGIEGDWVLQRGTATATMIVERSDWDGSHHQTDVAYHYDEIEIVVKSNAPVKVDKLEVTVLVDGKEAELVGMESLVLKNSGKGATFSSGPIRIAPNKARAKKMGGPAIVAGEYSQISFVTGLDNEFVSRPTTGFMVYVTPARMLRYYPVSKSINQKKNSYLWKEALQQAANMAGKKVVDWNDLTVAKAGEIANTIILEGFKKRKVNVTVAHHAAMILLRRLFIEQMTKYLYVIPKEPDPEFVKLWHQMVLPHAGEKDFGPAMVVVTTGGHTLQSGVPQYHGYDMTYGKALRIVKGYKFVGNYRAWFHGGVWRTDWDRQAFLGWRQAIIKSITLAKETDITDIEDMVELTGEGFGPLVKMLLPRLVKLKERGTPAQLVWVPDTLARLAVQSIESIGDQARAIDKVGSADTAVVIGAASLVAFAPATVPTKILCLAAEAGMAVEVGSLIVDYFKSIDAVDFAIGASQILEKDRLNAAKARVIPSWGVALGVAGSVVGLGSETYGLITAVRVSRAIDKSMALLPALERGGFDAFRNLSKEDQIHVLTAITAAKDAQKSLILRFDPNRAQLSKLGSKLDAEAASGITIHPPYNAWAFGSATDLAGTVNPEESVSLVDTLSSGKTGTKNVVLDETVSVAPDIKPPVKDPAKDVVLDETVTVTPEHARDPAKDIVLDETVTVEPDLEKIATVEPELDETVLENQLPKKDQSGEGELDETVLDETVTVEPDSEKTATVEPELDEAVLDDQPPLIKNNPPTNPDTEDLRDTLVSNKKLKTEKEIAEEMARARIGTTYKIKSRHGKPKDVELEEFIGSGLYCDVYSIKGDYTRVIKVAKKVGTRTGKDTVLNAERIQKLLDDNDIFQLKILEFAPDADPAFMVQEAITPGKHHIFNYKKEIKIINGKEKLVNVRYLLSDITPNGKLPEKAQRAILQLFKEMAEAKQPLAWEDCHIQNIFLVEVKEGNGFRAGILDQDRIARFSNISGPSDDLPPPDLRMYNVLKKLEKNITSSRINSLHNRIPPANVGIIAERRGTLSPNARFQMAKMLEYKGYIRYDKETRMFKEKLLDPKIVEKFFPIKEWIDPDLSHLGEVGQVIMFPSHVEELVTLRDEYRSEVLIGPLVRAAAFQLN